MSVTATARMSPCCLEALGKGDVTLDDSLDPGRRGGVEGSTLQLEGFT